MSEKYEVVMCIVNAGFSDLVMDAAREVGAGGGTVIHARGTAKPDAEKFFQITIQPDKDIVMILVPERIKDDVLHAVYQSAGLKTDGQGIAFSMPVDDVVGISAGAAKALKEAHAAEKEEHTHKEERVTEEEATEEAATVEADAPESGE